MKSIKTKLISIFTLLVFIICLGLGISSYIIASQAMESTLNNILPQAASQSASILDNKIQGKLSVLENIANENIIKNPHTAFQDKKQTLENVAKKNGYINVGISDKDGNLFLSNGQSLKIDDRQYFKTALCGKSNISDIIKSKINQASVICYAVPIIFNGENIGILTAVTESTELSDMIKALTFGKNGHVSIINKKGDTIADIDNNLVINKFNIIEAAEKDTSLKSLANIQKEMIKGSISSGEYKFNGETKLTGYCPLKSTNWIALVYIPKSEILSGLNILKLWTPLISLVFLLISIFFIRLVAKSITLNLQKSSKHLKIISEGDFTETIGNVTSKDEAGEIIHCVKKMQKEIKALIENVKNHSENISHQTEILSSTSKEMAYSSENVSTSIQDVALGTSNQAEYLVNMTNVLEEFNKNLEDIIFSICHIGNNSKQINSMAENSNKTMYFVIKSINSFSNSFKIFEGKITVLGDNIHRINEITSVINNIAEQTNLLALNAAIEAARAGDSGRGFSIVADEIRKLSEQSKNSSLNITNLINKISYDTMEMVKNSYSMDKELKKQVTAVTDVISSFETITKAIKNIIPELNSLNELSNLMKNQKNLVLEKIDEISSIAQESSVSSEEIASASEEMNSFSQNLASISKEVAFLSKDMLKNINKFKL